MGQGTTLAPLTVAGMTDVAVQDTGAASGLINVAHQLGGSLGLAVLVALFAVADVAVGHAQFVLAQRIAAVLSAGTVMLILAWLIVVVWIVWPQKWHQQP